jgi:tetratricopeptide (TPR) repeat protein
LERFPQHPESVHWRFELAQALVKLGKFSEAADEYQAVLEKNPIHPGAHEGLADLAEKQGLLDLAVKRYQACIATFPDSPKNARWQESLANLWCQLGDLDAAESQYQEMVEKYPAYAAGRRGLEKVRRYRQGA